MSTAYKFLKFPRSFPSQWVLKRIAFPPPPAWYHPTTTPDGLKYPPKISLEQQEELRQTCIIAGLDPEKHLGLPKKVVRNELSSTLRLGTYRVVEKYEKEKKVARNMEEMPARIAAYREEIRKRKEAAKSDMPF